MLFASKKANLAFWIAGLVAIGLMASTAHAAGPASFPQPATIGWQQNYSPPSAYGWNEHLVYLFEVTSKSNQTQRVNVTMSSFEEADKGGPWSVRNLHYTLKPGASIKIRYDVITPLGPTPWDHLYFGAQANVHVEGYPDNWVSTRAEYYGK